MPRTIPNDRFQALVDAATAVLIEQGYRRTQMADVARRLGVAKGTLYLYVESKQALLHVVLEHADRAQPIPLPERLPVETPRRGATLAMLRARVRRELALPRLDAALARTRVADVRAELEGIAGELFDLLARHRDAITLLDRCAADHPELAAVWYGTGRDGVTAALARYLAERMRRRRLPGVADPELSARMLLENCVFWAVHRHHDPSPDPRPEVVLRAAVIEFVCRALHGE